MTVRWTCWIIFRSWAIAKPSFWVRAFRCRCVSGFATLATPTSQKPARWVLGGPEGRQTRSARTPRDPWRFAADRAVIGLGFRRPSRVFLDRGPFRPGRAREAET